MPYIKQEDRDRLDYMHNMPRNSGELNYFIHLVLDQYIKERGVSYQTYNDILGALEGVKLEFYRRAVSPYEDKKIVENGDIEFYGEELL